VLSPSPNSRKNKRRGEGGEEVNGQGGKYGNEHT